MADATQPDMENKDERDNNQSDTASPVEPSEITQELMDQKKRLGKYKESTPGVVYLSRIPTGMNVKILRQVLGEYGEIGRLFLQPNEKASGKKKIRVFTEGWVEFTKKRDAKKVASILNNQRIGGKRRAPWYDEVWNIRYLSRFRWEHLNERLAYERATHQQRMRTEIAQVKRETNFYIQNVEHTAKMKLLEKKGKTSKEKEGDRDWSFDQKPSEAEILAGKRKKPTGQSKLQLSKKHKTDSSKASLNKGFLETLFSGGISKSAPL